MLSKLNIRFLLTTLLLLFMVSVVCYAQNIEEQKQRVKKIEEDINFLDKQIELTQNQHKNTLNELVLLQNKVNSRKKLLVELDNEIQIQERDINIKSNHIKGLEQRFDTLEYYYKHLIINTYKSRDARAWFMYILASNSIEQGYRRWSYLKNYSKTINKQAVKIIETKEEIIDQKEKLTKLKAENIQKQTAREQEYIGLTKEEQQSRAFAKTLANKQSEYKKQLAQKKREADKLNKEVERMIAEAIRQEQIRQEKLRIQQEKEAAARLAENKTGQVQTPPPTVEKPAQPDIKLSGNFTSNKGKLPWPVAKGVIIETFGEHNHPTLPNVKLPFNNGINISTTKNANVISVFDGVVKQIVTMPGYNQCILVQHGTYFTFYCKLDTVLVKVGENVKIGTILGNLEENQNTSVLHFELWNGTTKQNPEYWLKKQ